MSQNGLDSAVLEAVYTSRMAARISRVDFWTLDYWLRSGFVPASVRPAAGRGNWRLLSFPDVAALRVAGELRRQGVSLQSLRKVVSFLRESYGLRHPLAESVLVTNGMDVFKVSRGAREAVSVLRRPGQGVFFSLAIGAAWREAKREAARVLLEHEEHPSRVSARVASARGRP